MKQKLLALAAVLSAFGAGTVVFMNWENGTVERVIADTGSWQAVDRSSCATSACNAPACTVAQNHLTDAGSPCVPRFIDCDFRITQHMRDLAAIAGDTLGAQTYQRLRVIALRCPAAGGGFSFGVPFSDAGWPVFASVLQQTPLCVRARVNGTGTCTRDEHDGGSRYFGAGNVFPAADAVGPDCEPVGCSVFFGDNPDVSL